MSESVLLAGFLKWEAGVETVLLCDGGTLTFDGERYRETHPVFGTLAGFESITEGVGDEAPAGMLTFSPHPDADPAAVNSAALQGTRIRMWIGEVDQDTGLLIGAPDLMFDSLVDVTRLTLGKGGRTLEVDIVSRAERLFLLNEGNTLSSQAHRRIYPNEAGLDNATGVGRTVAWGVNTEARGTSVFGVSVNRIVQQSQAR